MRVTSYRGTRYGVFVHDPEGDMGYGAIVGPFYDAGKAEAKAEALMRRSSSVEAIVLPIREGKTSLAQIVEEVT